MCAEQPELLAGQPIGMYHCPLCGMMIVAGLPHPEPSEDNPDYQLIGEMEGWFIDERPNDLDNPCSVCGQRMPINPTTAIFSAHYDCTRKESKPFAP